MSAAHTATVRPETPLLVYDGDCGFCRYWVHYARSLTEGRVEFRPYQDVEDALPHRSREELSRAVWLYEPDGTETSAAHASFRVLARAPGHGLLLWCYRAIPGFSRLAETAYRAISSRREGAFAISRLLWGPRHEKPESRGVTWVFLKFLALIYFAAFVSFALQAPGLVGSAGISPGAEFLANVDARFGVAGVALVPTVFWLDAHDETIMAVAVGGAVAAVTLLFGIRERLSLIVAYILYLSLVRIGQVFTAFQWDVLLLEVGFLAIFLPGRSRLIVWLFRWLVFRFFLLSGVVKVAGGDSSWLDLSALSYHYETQPLPTILAWYADKLPSSVHAFTTALALFIELAVPFAVFMPRRVRFAAAGAFGLLQLSIIATGSYNFFNLLALALLLFLLDDRALARLLPGGVALPAVTGSATGRGYRLACATMATVALVVGTSQIVARLAGTSTPSPVASLARILAPLSIVNTYGPFAMMTRARYEIVIEGSTDRRQWRAYPFRYKPGPIDRAPGWVIPHQPRLDWQMWFAALGPVSNSPWFGAMVVRLLDGSAPVLDLFEYNPFPRGPPRYLRARRVRYRFSDAASRAATGAWWTTEPAGIYLPVTHLSERGQRR